MGLVTLVGVLWPQEAEAIPTAAGDSARPGRVGEPGQSVSASRAERHAQNEDWCRDLNERKAKWIKDGHLTAGFRCECWMVECGDRIQLSGKDWHQVRSRDNRFAVAPGHIDPEVETVIERHSHFWLVEKTGEAGEAAEKLA